MGIYEAYYNCRQEPFSLSPDPSFLYLAPSHREALAQFRYVVDSRKGFAVLTGEVGMGKTTLLRAFLEQLGTEVNTAYFVSPPHSRSELYGAIASEFGIKWRSVGSRTNELNEFLLDNYRAGRNVVMIFDEAQALNPKVLEEIRLITNFETSDAKLLQVILAGQPEFDTMLDSDKLRALRQRVIMRYRLVPLGREDTVQYIAARVRTAGAESSPFTYAACEAVCRYSKGIPRVINLLCDNALLAGYARDSQSIGRRQIDEVAKDLRLVSAEVAGVSEGRDRPRLIARRWLARVAALLGFVMGWLVTPRRFWGL